MIALTSHMSKHSVIAVFVVMMAAMSLSACKSIGPGAGPGQSDSQAGSTAATPGSRNPSSSSLNWFGQNQAAVRGSRGGQGESPGDLQVAEDGQAEILQAQEAHVRKAEVTVEARVCQLLSDDTQGLPHQRFLIHLNNGSTVLVAHDTKLAPHVPVSQGDLVRIHGEYIWNGRGGVLHWTHHSLNGRHEAGWIDYNGLRYQ